MKKERIDRLLKYRPFWVLAGVLPLVMFAVVMLFVFTQQQERTIRRLLEEASDNMAHRVEFIIGEQISLLKGLASSRALDNADYTAFRLDAQRFWKMHPEWRTIILAEADRPILDLRFPSNNAVPPLQDPLSLRKVLETGKPSVGDLVNNHLAIHVPVIRNGRVVFTLVAPLQSTYLENALSNSTNNQEWGFIIVGSDDVVISATKNAHAAAGQPLPKSFRQKNRDNTASVRMRYAESVSIRFAGWRIFTFAPAAMVESPFRVRRLAVFIGGALAGGLTILLVLALSSAWVVKQETIHLRREIEERERVEKERQESEKRYQSLVENTLDGYYFSEIPSGKFIFLNQRICDLFGYTMPEAIELTLWDVIDSQEHRQIRENLQARLQGRELVHINNIQTGVRKDGSRFRVEVSSSKVSYKGKSILQGVVRDVTERERLQMQLQQSQKLESIGRLAGGVAHDYNNMLNVIIGYAEMGLEDLGKSNPLRVNLEEILNAARRSAVITRQLLAFARQQTIAPMVLDVNKAVEGMLKILRRLIGEDIDLAWHPKAEVWPVKMDPTQIDQILANLCVNARDAISDVGSITIETDMVNFDQEYCQDHPGYIPGDFIMLAVSDTGCGMDRQTLEKIFEPFFTTKPVGEGTGLGMATVYGIVKQNQGFINIYSEPGRGSSFKIYLPRHMGGEDGEDYLPTLEIPYGRGEIILVVEDDVSILNLIERILNGLNYRTLTAHSPAEALQLGKTCGADISLLITDVVMPEMNGLQLSERLQTYYPKLKCLFMSGYTANVIAHRGIFEKSVSFIQKPFSKRDLALKIRATLEKQL